MSIVYLRAVGGESASPAALAPKVGPLGMVRLINYFESSNRLPRRLVMISKRLPWTGRVLRSLSSSLSLTVRLPYAIDICV